jgi:hypothetical protein
VKRATTETIAMADDEREDERLYEAVRQLSWTGPSLPVGQTIEVQYADEPGVHLDVRIARLAADAADDALKALAGCVGEKDARALLKIEAALFKWLRESADRPARFLSDPLAALRQTDVELGDAAWSALAKYRDAQLKSLDAAALASVNSVRVTAARTRRTRGP